MLTKYFLSCAVLLQAVVASPIELPKRVSSTGSVRLQRTGKTPPSSKALVERTRASYYSRRAKRAASSSLPLLVSDEGAGYAIDFQFGNETFSAIFDTGSSDLWLPQSGFQCVNAQKQDVSFAECGFPADGLYDGTYEEGQIADENFNITYGDGEFLTGTVGKEDVTVAGVTVDSQEVALVTEGYWEGDNVTDGLFGFAYPSLTSAYAGTNPEDDTEQVEYNPYIINAIDEGKIDPYFALTIERGPTGGGGELTLGGYPTNYTYVSTPLEGYSSNSLSSLFPGSSTSDNTTYYYYTITPDGFAVSPADSESTEFIAYEEYIIESLFPRQFPGSGGTGSGSSSLQSPVIVDSGTTLIYLSFENAASVNAAFNPPASYIEEEGLFEAECNATAPTFAVRINGTDFYVDSQDILLQGELGYDDSTGLCVTGVQAGSSPYILGDVFLKNVVAVFDVGNSEMLFAAHTY